MEKHKINILTNALAKAEKQDHVATIVVSAQNLLTDKPDDADLLLKYGYALARMARYKEAVDVLMRALDNVSYERMYLAYLELGNNFKIQNNYKEASEWYQRAIDARSFDTVGYIAKGGAYARQGLFREAESVYRSGLGCEEGCFDELHYNLGVVLLGQDKLIEAEKCFERALELDPEYKIAERRRNDVREAIRLQVKLN